MSVKVAENHAMGTKELRKEFCETLIAMAEEDNRVVVLDADLMNAAGTKPFRAAFPERTFDCGVQEANMIGVAAGLSSRGFIPFTHTFGPFAARRACDQIFMSCAYAKQNVKVIGSDPGITAALNGGTHMPFEDMGIMSTIPEMTVVEPCDVVSVNKVIRLAKETFGTWYIRLHRKPAPTVYEAETDFVVGKANLLKDGTDVTIIAMGYMVAEALKAAETLAAEGINARVLDMWCMKPLDEEAVLAAAKETGAIVTAENHNIKNGLGSAVASCLALNCPTPVEMVGVQDEFGEVGPVNYLAERFKLTADEIVAKTKKVLARK
ncbi:MAG: transketolase family protein [Oscillospiraceae bacterium]|nr:transketolase family protein [Oscillospiraceae bacterium]